MDITLTVDGLSGVDLRHVLDLDWLKHNCQMIHYFGLGFIQLKIDKEYRMHFYTPELPPIISEEDVHNHRYDFTSVILCGSLTQEIYECVDEKDTHILEEESCQPGIKCETTQKACGIKLLGKQFFSLSSRYWTHHDTFHRVSTQNCITLLRRSEYKKNLAQVIRPKDALPICPFSKKVEESELWEIIERMLR